MTILNYNVVSLWLKYAYDLTEINQDTLPCPDKYVLS